MGLWFLISSKFSGTGPGGNGTVCGVVVHSPHPEDQCPREGDEQNLKSLPPLSSTQCRH